MFYNMILRIRPIVLCLLTKRFTSFLDECTLFSISGKLSWRLFEKKKTLCFLIISFFRTFVT